MKTLSLPSAFEAIDQIDPARLAIFLDYDGTLTPIVSHPSEAILSESMRRAIRDLAAKFPVAIISGRDLPDVQNLVGLEGIYYAGSHGLDICGPKGLKKAVSSAEKVVPLLDEKEESIQALISEYKGAEVERKRFSFAVHYRNLEEKRQNAFREKVEKIGKHPQLKWRYGKKVLELQPNIEWDKGKALQWVLKQMHLEAPFSIYMGDDLTDEDAFKVIGQEGMGIVIADEERETAADYRLQGPEDVQRFIRKLLELA